LVFLPIAFSVFEFILNIGLPSDVLFANFAGIIDGVCTGCVVSFGWIISNFKSIIEKTFGDQTTWSGSAISWEITSQNLCGRVSLYKISNF